MGYLQRRGGLRAETLQDKGPYFAWETIQGTVAWPEAEKPEGMEGSSIRQSCAYGEVED